MEKSLKEGCEYSRKNVKFLYKLCAFRKPWGNIVKLYFPLASPGTGSVSVANKMETPALSLSPPHPLPLNVKYPSG